MRASIIINKWIEEMEYGFQEKKLSLCKLSLWKHLLSLSRETCSGKIIVPEIATQTHH